MTEAEKIIARLALQPHPEGGWYRQTWVGPLANSRPTGTAILFLLQQGERSQWHRVDATEVWHFYVGDPMQLSLSANGIASEHHVLGLDLARGERPQIVVPAHVWQSARPLGRYTLVGCTVVPPWLEPRKLRTSCARPPGPFSAATLAARPPSSASRPSRVLYRALT